MRTFAISALAATLSTILPLTLALPEGLIVDVTEKAAKCDYKTAKGDQVKMHYRGTLQESGTQFDASYDRGTPLEFELGAGRVIKGWDEGLLDMCVGEKRKLTIPPELGYGQRPVGPIPAGSTLVFETELVDVISAESKRDEL
ncbi:MAG: hypothetical protein Q9160_005243 [Pyrenula sp. 1 TL-2023]